MRSVLANQNCTVISSFTYKLTNQNTQYWPIRNALIWKPHLHKIGLMEPMGTFSLQGGLPLVSGLFHWLHFPGLQNVHLNKIFPISHLTLGIFVDSSKGKERVPQPGMQWKTFWGKKEGYKIFFCCRYIYFSFLSPQAPTHHPQTPICTLSRVFLGGTLVSLYAPPCFCPPACSHHCEDITLPGTARRSPSWAPCLWKQFSPRSPHSCPWISRSQQLWPAVDKTHYSCWASRLIIIFFL